jgi:hypothetical protein
VWKSQNRMVLDDSFGLVFGVELDCCSAPSPLMIHWTYERRVSSNDREILPISELTLLGDGNVHENHNQRNHNRHQQHYNLPSASTSLSPTQETYIVVREPIFQYRW